MKKILNTKVRLHWGAVKSDVSAPLDGARAERKVSQLIPEILYMTRTRRKATGGTVGPRNAMPGVPAGTGTQSSGLDAKPTLDPGRTTGIGWRGAEPLATAREEMSESERPADADGVEQSPQALAERVHDLARRIGGTAGTHEHTDAARELAGLLASPDLDASKRSQIVDDLSQAFGGGMSLLAVARQLESEVLRDQAERPGGALPSFLALHSRCLSSGRESVRGHSISDLNRILLDPEIPKDVEVVVLGRIKEWKAAGMLHLQETQAVLGIPEAVQPENWETLVDAARSERHEALKTLHGTARPVHAADVQFAGYLAADHLTGQSTSDEQLDELHRMNDVMLETRVHLDRGNTRSDMRRTGNQSTRKALAGTALIEDRLAGLRDPDFMSKPGAAGQQSGVARYVGAGLCDENGLDAAVGMGGRLKPGEKVAAVKRKKYPHVMALLNGRTTGDPWAENSAMKSSHHVLTKDPARIDVLVEMNPATGAKAVRIRDDVVRRLNEDPEAAEFVEEEVGGDLPLTVDDKFVYNDMNYVDPAFAREARDAVLQEVQSPAPSLQADHLGRMVAQVRPQIDDDWQMQRTRLHKELGLVDALARGGKWTKPSIAKNMGEIKDQAANLDRRPQNFPVREIGWPPPSAASSGDGSDHGEN